MIMIIMTPTDLSYNETQIRAYHSHATIQRVINLDQQRLNGRPFMIMTPTNLSYNETQIQAYRYQFTRFSE